MLGNALYFPFLALFLVNVLHVSYVDVGVIIAVIGTVQLPFNYLGGLLTDRFGRRRLILLGLAAEAVTTAAVAYSFAIESLVGAVVTAAVGGIVTSAAAPAASAYIADLASGAERTRGFTFYRIGFNAGYSAGVTLGGVLVSVLGFAAAVYVAAGVIAVGGGFLAVTLEPSPRDLALAAPRDRPLPGGEPEVPGRSLRASFRVLAQDRVALELLLAVLFAGLVAGQWAVTFPLYVRNVLGISYAILGVGLALNGLVVVFGQTATTESVLGWRHTSIAIAGVLLYAVAFVGLGAAGLFGALPTVVFFVAVVVLTIGENLITIPQATLPSNLAPAGEVGAYNGAFGAVGGAGFLVSVLLGGFALAATANPLLVWVVLVVPAVPAIVLFRHAARRLSREVDTA